MSKRRRDLILHRAERALAAECRCTVADVNAALDQHPIEYDRERYLRRALALQLCELDALSSAYRAKALAGDVASGVLLVKIAERKSTLLGLNAPQGHAVAVVQPPVHKENSMDRIERVLAELVEEDRAAKANGSAAPDEDDDRATR